MPELEKSTTEFRDYIIQDVLGYIDGVTSRGMFGGYGLYLPDEQYGKIMFGGIAEDRFFLRSDDDHKDALVALGCEQFIYYGHKDKKPSHMPWWFVPEDLAEDRERLEMFVYEAFDIAKANKK